MTAAVYRVLKQGNAARDRRDWAAAAAAYRAALAADPGLAHIWVQLGNMLKEVGDAPGALDAYAEAARLAPGDAEPLLQAAHLHVRLGRHGEAGDFFLRAFEADPNRGEAAGGLHRAVSRARGPARTRLLAALSDSMAARVPVEVPMPVPRDGSPVLVFDVSDLVRFWTGNRLPTGIQRTQIQLVTHALGRPPGPAPIVLCCFADGRDEWLELGPELFRRTVALSLRGGSRDDPDWIAALHLLHARLLAEKPFVFPRGAVLANLGSSWDLHNYFLFVREAKRRFGVRYVPLVFDLIPVLGPAHFTAGARHEFLPWVPGVLTHADRFLTISEASRRDLLRVSRALGVPRGASEVDVVPLDADSRPPGPELPDGALAEWGLRPGGFVLLVSTVEARKGHAVALEAWSLLIARYGAAVVPRLVCVGKRGWLSEPVYARLKTDAVLAGRVSMLEGVGDAGLSLLYRTCLFTLYPSLYEGWGLPVTEALCHGKAVVTTDTSSLPEAGGAFATYVPAGDAAALADEAGRMAFDPAWRAEAEARIRTGFRARSWDELADQVTAALLRLAEAGGAPVLPAPVARPGAFHTLARPALLRLWPGAEGGEAFRVGTGWLAPDAAGSRVQPGGGTLAIGMPPGTGSVFLALLLVGPRRGTVRWQVAADGGPAASGWLREGARKWVAMTCPADCTAAGTLMVQVRSRRAAVPDTDSKDADSNPEGLAEKAEDGWADDDVAAGVAGFYVSEAGTEGRMRLMEAVALGNLDELDAYREPDDDDADDAWKHGEAALEDGTAGD